jgi:hypothetical protein
MVSQAEYSALEYVDQDDLVELAIVGRLQVNEASGADAVVSYEEAYNTLRWALDVQKYPEGLPSRPFVWIWSQMLWNCTVFFLVLIVVSIMLSTTKSLFGYIKVEDGVLVAADTLAHPGEEPVASTAAVIAARHLHECALLPSEILRQIRDVTISHKGVWRCIHVAHVAQFRASHLWLEGHDGSGIRLLDGLAFFRNGRLGSEEPLSLDGSDIQRYLSASNETSSRRAALLTNWVPPQAFFHVARKSEGARTANVDILQAIVCSSILIALWS